MPPKNKYLTGKPKVPHKPKQVYREQVMIGVDVDGGSAPPPRSQAYHEQVEIGMDVDGGILNERKKGK